MAKTAIKSVLLNNLPKCSQVSPVIPEYVPVKKIDEDGMEYYAFTLADNKSVIASLGTADQWSLNALLKAGINPQSMSIHTSYATRLEGVGDIQEIEQSVNDFFDKNKE